MQRLNELVTDIVKVIVVILFIVMVILVFAQVYTRFITNNSLTWSEELSRFIMIWMVFLGAALTYKENAHMCVDNVVNMLPKNWCKFINILSVISQFLFLGLLLWGAYAILPTTFMQKSPANDITMAYVYIAIPISAVLMTIALIAKIIHSVKEGRGKKA